jgi:hypothetical protein
MPPVGRQDSKLGVAAGEETRGDTPTKAWPRIYTDYTHLPGHICEDPRRSAAFLERSTATTAEAAAGEAAAAPTEAAAKP